MSVAENDLVATSVAGSNWIFHDEHGRVQFDLGALKAEIDEAIDSFASRRDDLLAGVARMPETITDEDTNNKASDTVRMIAACIKNAEAERVARKEPFRLAGSLIDAVFDTIITPLGSAKGRDPAGSARYIVNGKKTDFEREKEAAERRRREAIAAAERAEAQRLAREAAEREAAARSEDDLNAAITAEQLARQQAADAEAARRAAEAQPAELSRSRSDMGAVSSLRRWWDHKDLDRATLDLETLRDHLPIEALEQAVRSYIRAGGRKLRGVVIFENTASQTR